MGSEDLSRELLTLRQRLPSPAVWVLGNDRRPETGACVCDSAGLAPVLCNVMLKPLVFLAIKET